tara:strand:- start:468 stop:3491 length:3024 start_codon:yes stop_codon:yes gene_type:complete
MSQYTDIQMIECNNQSSTQHLSGNDTSPATYTNKLGTNIALKRGDKLSMEYCFINQRGCGTPDGIEIKGERLDTETKKFYISKISGDGEEPIASRTRMETQLYQKAIWTEIPKTLTEDKIFTEINYYHSTNGEGYYFLPRRFLTPEVRLIKGTVGKALNTSTSETKKTFTSPETIADGRCFYERGIITDTDSMCESDMMLVIDSDSVGMYKPKSDGGKMTILVRDFMIQKKEYNLETKDYWENRILDPCAGSYMLYQELLELSMAIGFNSPANISTRLTQEIQKKMPTEEYYAMDDSEVSLPIKWGSTESTITYKPFNSAWVGGNSKANFDSYMISGDAGTAPAMNYDCSYQYIGIKRPDLFIAGRLTRDYNDANKIKVAITGSQVDNVMEPITTGYEWGEALLKKLSDLFIIQGNYPELFVGSENHFGDGTDINIDTARFLHMNRYTDVLMDNGLILGDDNIITKAFNRNSIPVFFKYDGNNAGRMTDGLSTSSLSYGFATKTRIDGTDYITLHPELIGGIRPYIFKHTANIVADTIQIGWDYHFNAYSTIASQIFSGYPTYSYDDTYSYGVRSQTEIIGPAINSAGDKEKLYFESLNLSSLISRTYLGTNNGALEYDETGHFAFSDLHTAENLGNKFDSGSTLTNPLVVGSDKVCYKINKRMNLWSWTPEMKPYIAPEGVDSYGVKPDKLTVPDLWTDGDTIASAVVKEAGQHDPSTGFQSSYKVIWGAEKYDPMNQNIVPYSIMDSHCGIIMNLGNSSPEETFSDSLLGVLGFTWKQFNPSIINSENNITARTTSNNIFNLKYVSTNSDILTTQLNDLVVNRFGAVQYTTQIPVPIVLEGWINRTLGNTFSVGLERQGDGNPHRDAGFLIYPPVVEETQSIKVRSELLPRRMIRPYYTIRSDVLSLGNNKYIGGRDANAKLPIIAIVNKENGFGDYYFSVESPMVFTINQDTMLSSITTSIHDPNQRTSDVGEGCAVIYKIQREKILDNNIIQEILENKSNIKK